MNRRFFLVGLVSVGLLRRVGMFPLTTIVVANGWLLDSNDINRSPE